MSTEVRFIEALEPVTDLEVKFTEASEPVTYLNTFVDNEVRFIEALEPVTDFEAYASVIAQCTCPLRSSGHNLYRTSGTGSLKQLSL